VRATWNATRHASRGLFAALADLGAARLSPPTDPGDAAGRLSAAVRAICEAHDIVLRVDGELPRAPSLVVANHVSYLDPIAILSAIPAMPLAKAEVATWPVIGPIGRALGVAFVDRDDPGSRARVLRRIHDVLAAGTSVVNFPEGTTTDGARVLPFLRGSFGIAARLDAPVVPLAIRYRDPSMAWTDGATFLPHYVRMARAARTEVDLVIAPPMWARAGEPPELLAARARAVIARILDRMGVIDARARLRVPPPRPDAGVPPAGRRVA
jgi:1-acyl-sn-glycerol-3-phosphate acyltransferase